MMIFNKIKYKQKINNIPEEYIVSRKRLDNKPQIKIKISKILSVTIDNIIFRSIDFEENIWKIFIHKNFNKISLIHTLTTKYYLNKGLLHNEFDYAYNVSDYPCFFIKGKEVLQKDIVKLIRENKLKRILFFIN